MAPPGEWFALLSLRVLPVTTAVPPSLAMPAPLLVPVLPEIRLAVTIRRSPGGAGGPGAAIAGRAEPAQRGIQEHALRTGAAGRPAPPGWPFWPLRMPPPSFPATVLAITSTVPATLPMPPFCIPPPP